MEKDDELKGEGNSYTTHYRHYDPRIGRWKSLDPGKQKYPAFSPYSAYANNPILVLDTDGDTLRVHGGAAEITKFKAILDKTFAGAVTVQVAKNGTVTLHGDRSKLNANDKALYDALNTVITDKKTTDVVLLNKSQTKYAIGGSWQGATINGKKVNTIDLYDVEKYTSTGMSAEGLIIHEVWETYEDQVKGNHTFDGPSGAHEKAENVQGKVDGVTLDTQWGNFDNTGSGMGYTNITIKGKKYTVAATVKNMDVTKVETVEGWIVPDGKGGTKTIK